MFAMRRCLRALVFVLSGGWSSFKWGEWVAQVVSWADGGKHDSSMLSLIWMGLLTHSSLMSVLIALESTIDLSIHIQVDSPPHACMRCWISQAASHNCYNSSTSLTGFNLRGICLSAWANCLHKQKFVYICTCRCDKQQVLIRISFVCQFSTYFVHYSLISRWSWWNSQRGDVLPFVHVPCMLTQH